MALVVYVAPYSIGWFISVCCRQRDSRWGTNRLLATIYLWYHSILSLYWVPWHIRHI